MSPYELAEEYSCAAELLRERIRQLEDRREKTEVWEEQLALDSRLRPLRTMYREVRATERHLKDYYAHREGHNNE